MIFPRRHLTGLFWATLLATQLLMGCSQETVVIRLEQAELQQRLSAQFPITATKFFVKLTLKDPILQLNPTSNQVGLRLTATVAPPVLAQEFTGRVSAKGELFYNRDERAFYIRDPQIVDLTIDDLPAKYSKGAKDALGVLTRETLSRTPIYQLEGRNLKEVAAAHVLRKVEVKNGTLEAELGPPFAN